MAIIKWSPSDVFSDVDRMLDSQWMPMVRSRSINPAVDVYEDASNVIVEMPLAGIDPNKVSIEMLDRVLNISGQSEQKTEVDEQNYYRREVRFGSFHRAIVLPRAVRADQAAAQYQDGVLKITLPKSEEAHPRKIKITTA